MNILILSAGTRNKIVQYFKQEVGDSGCVVATDCSNLAPALYDADKYYIVPRITDENYLPIILDICKKEHINGIISLIDPELSLLAKHKEAFLELLATPVISPYEVVEMCFNKYSMYCFLKENGFHTARSYIDKEEFYKDESAGVISYPVFVKPVTGSASINISKVNTKKEVDLLFELYDDLMIQEFMDGQEYGADVYVDMISGNMVSVFVKEKIKMRAGETDKAVSFQDEKLFALIGQFTKLAGFSGIIDMDIFKIGNEYYISEVNPRFGGGYPHAFACGVNVPRLILQNLSGKENETNIGAYKEGVYMMKYNEIAIVEEA